MDLTNSCFEFCGLAKFKQNPSIRPFSLIAKVDVFLQHFDSVGPYSVLKVTKV